MWEDFGGGGGHFQGQEDAEGGGAGDGEDGGGGGDAEGGSGGGDEDGGGGDDA